MDDNVLAAQPRIAGSKGAARQLRFKGEVPGVFYFGSDVNVSFSVQALSLDQILRARHSLLMLEVEGNEPRECVVRDLQRDPVTDKILHIDLLGVKRGQKLIVSVPVRTVGIPVGVKAEGGVLQLTMTELDVECLPKDIPSVIEIDVTNLSIGMSLSLEELDFPELRFLSSPETTLATVIPPVIEKEPIEADEEEGEEEAEGEEAAEKEEESKED